MNNVLQDLKKSSRSPFYLSYNLHFATSVHVAQCEWLELYFTYRNLHSAICVQVAQWLEHVANFNEISIQCHIKSTLPDLKPLSVNLGFGMPSHGLKRQSLDDLKTGLPQISSKP